VASTSQPILNEREVNTIFFIGIEELQQLHVEIYRMLEPRVQGWSPTVCVGDVFVELVCNFILINNACVMYDIWLLHSIAIILAEVFARKGKSKRAYLSLGSLQIMEILPYKR